MPRRLRRHRHVSRWIFLAVLVLVIVRLGSDWRRPAVPDAIGEGVYQVDYVVDGDTLRLANGAKVRLIGVDTPELGEVAEPGAAEATAFTRHFLRNGQVRLRCDRERVDRYGRFLVYAYVDGQMLNEALLRQGLARARTNFNYNQTYKRIFRQAESEARQARRGIWSGRGVGG